MVIWTSSQDELPTPEDSPTSGARLRGLIQGAIGVAMAGLVYTLFSHAAGWVIFTIASTITLAALLSPGGLFAGIEAGFRAAGQAVRRLLTWILLSSIFYTFFLPFGVLFRRGRKDSMKRFYDSEAPSYWSPRQPRDAGLDFYRRQY
jgi:hypothetical protein